MYVCARNSLDGYFRFVVGSLAVSLAILCISSILNLIHLNVCINITTYTLMKIGVVLPNVLAFLSSVRWKLLL